MTTNYDDVSASYDTRYARHAYPGVATTLQAFVGNAPQRTLELGAGTGHWVGLLRSHGHAALGIDPSRGMLSKAVGKVPAQCFALARAEALPFGDATFDRVYAINAVHHFGDPARALREARRVLAPGGSVSIAGMDPSAGLDRWSIYDYFAGTEQRDRERFPSTAQLRAWLEDAGFERCETHAAELIRLELSASQALTTGALDKHVTSQLSELSDEAYDRGISAIKAANAAAQARGETLRLVSHLTLFATVGYAPA